MERLWRLLRGLLLLGNIGFGAERAELDVAAAGNRGVNVNQAGKQLSAVGSVAPRGTVSSKELLRSASAAGVAMGMRPDSADDPFEAAAQVPPSCPLHWLRPLIPLHRLLGQCVRGRGAGVEGLRR